MREKATLWTGVTLLTLAFCHPSQGQVGESDYIHALVTVTNSQGILAVEIPDNVGTNTLWDIGTVPAGGVADTWFDDDEHGSFRVRNAGDVAAHIYIVAEPHSGSEPWGQYPYAMPTPVVPPTDAEFAMAFATNIMDLLPTWQVLDLLVEQGPPRTAANMGFILPGDYILFDLRYYAPHPCCAATETVQFRLAFYALDTDNPDYIPPPAP